MVKSRIDPKTDKSIEQYRRFADLNNGASVIGVISVALIAIALIAIVIGGDRTTATTRGRWS